MNIPEGWQVTPIRATDEMHDAGVQAIADSTSGFVDEVYEAMLAAAPTPPAQEAIRMYGPFSSAEDVINSLNEGGVCWNEVERIADIPRVSEALANFAQDTTGDNGAEVVRVILEMTSRGKFEEFYTNTLCFKNKRPKELSSYEIATLAWQESEKQQEEEVARLRQELFYMTQRCAIQNAPPKS